MKKRVLIMVMISVLVLGNMSFANNLSDIKGHWAENNINRLNSISVINGYPDNTFKPNNTMTRAEFVKVLVSSINYDTREVNGKWYQKYLNSAKEEKIITNDLLYIFENPDKEITRMETVLLFNNLIRKEKELDVSILKEPKFIDVKSTLPLMTVYSYGIIEGYPDNTFKPTREMTRSEIATIFSNMFFGKRNTNDNLIKLPLFEEYKNKFDELTNKRIESIKNDTTLFDSLEEYHNDSLNDEVVLPENEVVLPENEVVLPENSEVPKYLQKRFSMISDKYNLTWTDEDFETWYKTSSDKEKEKYMSYEYSRPKFDFEKKIALISEPTNYKSGASQNLKNFNKYDDKYSMNDIGYVIYEMYKRNIEMLMKDNEDWGKFRVTHNDWQEEREVVFEVIDGEHEQRNSFLFWLIPKENVDSFRPYHYNLYQMVDQYDKDKDTEWWEKWEDTVYEYVNENTQMNMYFIHGKVIGSEIYDNYMDAYEQRMVIGLGSTPNDELNIETENIKTEHTNASGWLIYVEEK